MIVKRHESNIYYNATCNRVPHNPTLIRFSQQTKHIPDRGQPKQSFSGHPSEAQGMSNPEGSA